MSMSLAVNEHDPNHRKKISFYVAGFAIFQFGCLILAVVLASTPWFLTHDDYPGMQMAGYSLRAKHLDCEVLIYGDSSTLTGLDPAIIQKISGLKTCNISEGGTIQGVVGSSFPLDAYLRHNKRPRFLLMMFTSSLFQPEKAPFQEYQPEGVMYALQYDRGPQLYRKLLRKPLWIARFAIWSGHAIISDFLKHHLPGHDLASSSNPRAQRDSRNGIWPYPLPPETHCTRTATPGVSPVGRYAESVAAMRKRYGTGGTQVIINISPVPTCDVMQDVYRQRSEGLHDNVFESLPISYFNEGDVHFSPEGSRYISVEAGNQILSLENRRADLHMPPAKF